MADARLTSDTLASLERIQERLAQRSRILFITGAGLSADSGMPTYRGIGGLYNQGVTEDGVTIEEALSGPMLRRNPALCWKYIAQIEAACRGAEPNAGHRAIAALEDSHEVHVLTQNVDGLHARAGSTRVIPIHGDVHFLHCTRCPWTLEVADYANLALPPKCPDCSSLVRPEVVLFGEMLPSAPLRALIAEVERGFDVVFSVGTTSVFPYIADPVLQARARGALTVEVNPGDTPVSGLVEEKIAQGAAAVLSALRDRLR